MCLGRVQIADLCVNIESTYNRLMSRSQKSTENKFMCRSWKSTDSKFMCRPWKSTESRFMCRPWKSTFVHVDLCVRKRQ